MEIDIKAEVENLYEILADKTRYYSIPDYQRPYAWDKENVDNLLGDIFDAYIRNEKQYFCGTVVLLKGQSKKDRYSIIDGQQRTTTFVIIAAVLYNFFGDKLSEDAKENVLYSLKKPHSEEGGDKLKIQTDTNDSIIFSQQIVKRLELDKNSSSAYIKNAGYIKEFIELKLQEGIDLDDFVAYLYENVCLAKIVCSNEDTAINIFNVLNDRGLPLSPIDILKSRLMIDLDEESRKIFKKTWDNILSKLSESSLEINELLSAFTYFLIAKNPTLRADKEVLNYYKNLYPNKLDSLEIIKDLSDFTDAYIAVVNSKNRYVYLLHNLRSRIYWVSILSTAKFLNIDYFDRLANLLVAYYYKSWIAGGSNTRIKNPSFNMIAALKNNKGLNAIKDIAKKSLDRFNSEELFNSELRMENAYEQADWIKPVLIMYDNFISENPKLVISGKNITLEHILPKSTGGTSWQKCFTQEEILRYKNSMANLLLLSQRKNSQASNMDFAKKCYIYLNKDGVASSFPSTLEVIKNTKEWNASEILARENKIINKLKEKLDIDKI